MRVLITGSCGLIGSEAVRFFAPISDLVCGIDNDMRKTFFGPTGSTAWVRENLSKAFKNYRHHGIDIRSREHVLKVFEEVRPDLIIHTAAQPSHDWAARDPFTDFEVNAAATLNLLETTRKIVPESVFIFTSTNKVYGDGPNYVPLTELKDRFEYENDFRGKGISENFSVDQCLHSLFGASKLSADTLVQEYGRYFGMRTGVFRGGCLTGSFHSGVELHGFLSYFIHCAFRKKPYTVFGYKGKQVRDQIHSLDVLQAFDLFRKNPRAGEVYNLGGGFENSASILELVQKIEAYHLSLELKFSEIARKGDHICYYTDMRKFKSHYPSFQIKMNLEKILEEMIEHASHDARAAA